VTERAPATLVVLPGVDGTDVFFRPFLARLPASIRPLVVCYPERGAETYDDVFQIVRRAVAGIPEFFVLGSSFSGPLAIRLAAAEPQRVRGLILSASFLRAPRRDLGWFSFAIVGPAIWALRAMRRIPVWMRKRDDPFRRAKAETWARVSARCLAARGRAIRGVDVRRLLQQCEQPLLCIAFENDSVVPRRNAEEILAHRPAGRMVTVPGDHLAMCTDPARWTDEVVRFVHEHTHRRK
jgi:pimeloyl-ACP methyl ester carboxylesterase